MSDEKDLRERLERAEAALRQIAQMPNDIVRWDWTVTGGGGRGGFGHAEIQSRGGTVSPAGVEGKGGGGGAFPGGGPYAKTPQQIARAYFKPAGEGE